jgi:nucleotide-binding universal stress UspA family protein
MGFVVREKALLHKVLVAVDGSEQSLRAIRYAAGVFSPERTRIVLFHVQAQLYELFSDLDAYPHYKSRVTGLKRWATEQKMDIDNTMNSALAYFKQKGFAESAITIKTPAKKLGITEDILKESYDGYHALVVGRVGWNRFKHWLLKSTAMKLVAKIKHIPVVVVGGNPDAKHLLVAFDGTHGAMKGVVCVGALVDNADHHLRLYSIIRNDQKFWSGDGAYFKIDDCRDKIIFEDQEIGKQLEEARTRLLAENIPSEQLSLRIHAVDRDRAAHIVQAAEESNFGSIVVGRRGLVTFIDEVFVGRVSDQVLKLADQLAVWVI